MTVLDTSALVAVLARAPGAPALLDQIAAGEDLVVVPFDVDQVELAHAGFVRYGEGRHPAALDLGDLYAYALAKAHGAPLLYVGNDFARTDATPA